MCRRSVCSFGWTLSMNFLFFYFDFPFWCGDDGVDVVVWNKDVEVEYGSGS